MCTGVTMTTRHGELAGSFLAPCTLRFGGFRKQFSARPSTALVSLRLGDNLMHQLPTTVEGHEEGKGDRLLNRKPSRQSRCLTHRPHPTCCRSAAFPPLCSSPDAIADANRVQCANYFSLSDALEELWRYFDDPSWKRITRLPRRCMLGPGGGGCCYVKPRCRLPQVMGTWPRRCRP
jgi:hypothetical protein